MSAFLCGLGPARRAGRPYGVASVCSAQPVVLRAALRRAANSGRPLLVEATCNQVNQFGGYTGMTPADFVAFVKNIARQEGVRHEQIIFGGDHLGPNPWRRETAQTALKKAAEMVAAYVTAGFGKIHLDASMGCAGEAAVLDDDSVAQRAAMLCAAAEKAAASAGLPAPLYVLGTEVPVPGGADHALQSVEPTTPEAARKTIAVHRAAFASAGLAQAFERVIAFVVQPGVEFGSDNVIAYNPTRAAALSDVLNEEPALVFEAHSTDYQTEAALAALVGDGFPILKVGPALTFAYREALYGLDLVAAELVDGYDGRVLANTMEALMLASPDDWRGYYHGDAVAQRIQRHYSYSDRIRYYWARPEAEAAVAALLATLERVRIPETVLHQFLPQIAAEEAGVVENILIAAVDKVLVVYDNAAAGKAFAIHENS